MLQTGLKISGLAIIIMVGIVVWTLGELPAGEKFPIHFNAQGEVDGYGTRGDVTFVLSLFIAISAFTFGILAAVPKFMPKDSGLENSKKAYLAIWGAVAAFMSLIMLGVAITVLNASKGELSIDFILKFVTASLAGLMLVMGNYFPKIQPNEKGLFGFNTAWTLGSVTSWHRTHRLMGRLYMLGGIVSLVGAFTLPPVFSVIGVTVLLLGITAYGAFYSYKIWKTADDRIN